MEGQYERERKLIINYNLNTNLEWQEVFSETANAYYDLMNRSKHHALLKIKGRIWRFESRLKIVQA